MKCAACTFDNPDSSRFCGGCGRPLANACPVCGSKNPVHFDYCGGCGVALTHPLAATQARTQAAVPQGRQAERRRVTVLFADLVGSTTISGRLDPEDLRGLIRTYLTTCTSVVQRLGGRVSQYLGDGILANFGYPMAHEDDAERAVRAGLGLVEAVRELRPKIGTANIELAVRVGIATGLVIAGDSPGGRPGEEDGLIGETLNVAARLQAAAEPNTVMITVETRNLVGDRFVCQDLGTITLKGVSRPVQAWRVMHLDETLTRFEAAHPAGLTPLVGRREELEFLMKRWHSAAAGHGQVVLVSGEPGIGKSRIVQDLVERVGQDSPRVVLLQCSPHHSSSALYPVGIALERLAEFDRDDSAEQKLAKLEVMVARCHQPVQATVPLLAPVVSVATGDRYEPLSVTQQRQREMTLSALQNLVESLAMESGLLLVFEDVHWIDPTSQEWLDVLVERASSQRMLAVLTYRPEYAPRWPGRPHLASCTLNRLSPAEAAEIAWRVANSKDLPAQILQHIVTKTDGVPLFIEELTKTVLESGLVQEHENRYELVGAIPPLAIPATLHDSLMARLDQLSSGPKVAQIGSAIGRQFSYDLLAAVASMADAELGAALDELVDAQLILRVGTPPRASYSFKHALVQDAAYGSLLLAQRQALHARIAEALETQFPETLEASPELVAHHCTEAHLSAKALHYWQLAGRRASERSANVEAISHLTRGLDLVTALPETVERRRQELDLLLALGPVLMNTKGPRTREVSETYSRALKLCSTLPDSPQHFAAMWGTWRIFEHFETALEIAQKLLDLAGRLGDPGLSLQAHHCLWASLFHLGRHGECCEHVREGMRLYDAGNYRAHVAVYAGHDPKVCGTGERAFSLWLLGFPDQALAASREAMVWARRLAHAGSLVHALDMSLLLHRYRRDAKTVQGRADELIQYSEAHGFSAHRAKGTVFLGWALAELGESERGIEYMREGLDALKALVTGEDFPILWEMLAETWVKAGKPALALEVLAEAFAEVERSGLCYWTAELYRRRGEALLALSPTQVAEAEADFHRALSVAREQKARSLELRAAVSLASLERGRGRTAAARETLDPVHAWFREGFDTIDLREARALLDLMAVSPSSPMGTS